MNPTPSAFDFERMAALAKEDPVAFAQHREELIRRAIDNSLRSQSLEDLQMSLDADRYCRPTGGIAPSEALFSMMIGSIETMEQAIAQLNDLVKALMAKDKA